MKDLAEFIAIVSIAAIIVGAAWAKITIWYQNHKLGPYVLEDLKTAHAALKSANDILEQLTKKEKE